MTLKELNELLEDIKEWYEEDELDKVNVTVYIKSVGASFQIESLKHYSDHEIEITIE